jgi:hypothetical protein
MTTGSPRRALVAALVVSVVTGLGGCSLDEGDVAARRTSAQGAPSATVDPDDPTPEDLDEIQRLLAARAQAALAEDREAFLATVDPKQPKLLAQQRTLYENLAALDLTRMSYDLDRQTLLVAAGVPGKDKTARPAINEYIQIEGTLNKQVINPVQMTFVQRESGWYLGAENQRKVTTSMESPQERPWFGGPIAVRRSGEMTVLVDRPKADILDGLVDSVRADIAYAADVLELKPEYDVLVDATSNGLSVDFSKLAKEEVAAVSFGLYGYGGRVGSAIKLNPENVAQVLDQENLMRHELTHYLLEDYNSSVPPWLSEGVAMYVELEARDLSRYVVDDEFWDTLQESDRDLPGKGTFSLDPSTNYFIGVAAVIRLVNRAGIDDLKRLMRAYTKAYDGPNVDALTARLLRKIYGMREQELVNEAFAELAELHH